jgi:hypothetical protein
VESADIDQRQQNGHAGPPPSPTTERNGIQSVDRALGLLDTIPPPARPNVVSD